MALSHSPSTTDLQIREVTFDDLKEFWIDHNHFENPNIKRYPHHVKFLGDHKSTYDEPAWKCYGLFYKDKFGEQMIGGTMLTQWQPHRVRYRTIHIDPAFRGHDLGWYLIENAWNMHWVGMGHLWGYIKDNHYQWALRHGFKETDNKWTDGHIGMVREMD